MSESEGLTGWRVIKGFISEEADAAAAAWEEASVALRKVFRKNSAFSAEASPPAGPG
jgi:hypothetical protein